MDCEMTQTAHQSERDRLLRAYERGDREFHAWNLDGADLSGCCLSRADFTDASFTGANLRGADLTESNLSQANLSRATLSRAQLRGSDLSRAEMADADLVGADLRQSLARATNFSNALMIRARLNDADCLGALMSGINATAAQFESANLECADLSGAAMMNSNLTGANCSWANLTDARLNWAQMPWCKLEACDLEQANLTGVSMRGANLSFANLDQAILTGADLYFANLSGALVPPETSAARISSVRLTSQTFSRSRWSKETLREWQHRGAMILDFEQLPRDVLTFIRKGDCNLRIYFSKVIGTEERTALETLIAHLMQDPNALRILSVSNDGSKSQIAFYAPEPETVDLFVKTLRNKAWLEDREALVQQFRQSYSSREKDIDIAAELEKLSDEICHIQALVPVSSDDKTRQLQIRLEPCEKHDEKAQISWSSVMLPRVSR